MIKVYYTFGTDEQFDYQSGWVEVIAPDLNTSHRAFKKFHPNRENSLLLNCADWYDSSVFEDLPMFKEKDNFGHGGWERIYAFVTDVSATTAENERMEMINYIRELIVDA